ncbi:MAG: hypothetical protein AAF928_08185 [Myxococcota bacterium]
MNEGCAWLFSGAFATAVIGCGMPSSGDTQGSATAAAASASSPLVATATAATPAPAKPLDVGARKKELKCSPEATEGPCGVLAAFDDCTAWTGQTSGGDGRWIGIGYDRYEGEMKEEVTLVRALRVPLDEVGPGQIGAKLSLSRIPETKPDLVREGKRAAQALFRGDVPKPQNPALQYVNARKDWSAQFATTAEKHQVVSADGSYFCNRADQRLLVFRPSAASGGQPGDGLYAVLRPTKW